MKLSTWLSSSASQLPASIRVGAALACFAQLSRAITFNSVPSPNLNLDVLKRVALVGDFDGISLYQFEGQNENGFNTNGSQSILSRFPNGGFATLASADAGIQAMCSFVMKDGTAAGVVVGGNFTSLGGVESAGVAMFNPNTSTITPLPGLSGQVSALYCDQDTNSVYVGGSFKAANSTNAIAWVGTSGWTNLPFAGLNGPVTSITKAANGNIIFGGTFTSLGNVSASSTNTPDQQIINISGANITSGSSTTTTGFSDPTNIVCKTNGADGAGNTWLLADDTAGFWKATFGFGFQPTKLRLWNTHLDGRGTQTWRFTAQPINGIMNFTYIDPATGNNASCSSECPLSSNSSVAFQDFHFVNQVGMNTFQIDISAWYGSGGGLDGIELFEDDIFAYAIDSFNEPACAGISTASNATVTGPWTVSPSAQSFSKYLTATSSESATVVFMPDIKQSGNYSVNIYTPGCLQDATCTTRGQVNITGIMASTGGTTGFNTQIFQTNNYDKYDQIYFGYIEAGSSTFLPSVTLSPVAGQNIADLTVVAQRVGFTLISSVGGLNGLFEYNPSQAVVNTADFANSTIDQAGTTLPTGGGVRALQTSGSTTFVGGNFTTSNYSNIFAVTSSGSEALTGNGLNGEVATMYLNGTTLYVGGQFTNTKTGGTTGLNNVAIYDTSKNTWSTLGAGVNGIVSSIVPLTMNITANQPETVITLTGSFDEILAFGKNTSIAVTGFAVWVPSHGNWLQNLPIPTPAINGELTVSVILPTGDFLFAGSLSSSQLGANGAVALQTGLTVLPITIRPSNYSSTGSQNISGVVTGLFYENGGRNVTILGGHFTAMATTGLDVANLAFINGSNSDAVTGIGSSISSTSTIKAVAIQGDLLYAGGNVNGTVNGGGVSGLFTYDLVTATFGTQPPSLTGGDVNSIAVRPSNTDVYVGGAFSAAGSLGCPGVCVFGTSSGQWNRPGTTLGGTANSLIWQSTNTLVVGGALTIGGVNSSVATYNVKTNTWAQFTGGTTLPGAVTAMVPANSDASQLWAAGTAANGSIFLVKYDGTNWNSAGASFGTGSNVRGLQIIPTTAGHSTSDLVPANEDLLILGNINLPGFGNSSGVIYNGTTFQPYLLTSTAANTGGSLSQIFTQEQNFFTTPGSHLAKGFVVLIGLAISLALIFLIVVAGVIAERLRKKREGYVPAPTASFDRGNGMSRVPPEQLFSSLGQTRLGVEKQSNMI